MLTLNYCCVHFCNWITCSLLKYLWHRSVLSTIKLKMKMDLHGFVLVTIPYVRIFFSWNVCSLLTQNIFKNRSLPTLSCWIVPYSTGGCMEISGIIVRKGINWKLSESDLYNSLTWFCATQKCLASLSELKWLTTVFMTPNSIYFHTKKNHLKHLRANKKGSVRKHEQIENVWQFFVRHQVIGS